MLVIKKEEKQESFPARKTNVRSLTRNGFTLARSSLACLVYLKIERKSNGLIDALPAACSLRGVRRKVGCIPRALLRKEMLLALLDRCVLRLRVFSIRIVSSMVNGIIENNRRN
ncbi:hypothetical protein Salat_2358500 [Sesamum alatum]|uniref:Uncharacterized protein n=1 Tax=Sesamum alatum TaxID=300844 RepID=A0AAE1XWS8_9LAMI|nr:hypothetical protein Salat_2358500 [Sesamum alatum]